MEQMERVRCCASWETVSGGCCLVGVRTCFKNWNSWAGLLPIVVWREGFGWSEREWRACIDFFPPSQSTKQVFHSSRWRRESEWGRWWKNYVLEPLRTGSPITMLIPGFVSWGLTNAVWAILKDWSCYRSDTLSWVSSTWYGREGIMRQGLRRIDLSKIVRMNCNQGKIWNVRGWSPYANAQLIHWDRHI